MLAQEGWTVKNLDKAYKDELAGRQKRVDLFIEFNNTLREYEQLFESIAALRKTTISFCGQEIKLIVHVEAMEEITPVLELIEDVVGYVFDSTHDYATEWSTMRTFTRKTSGWISVHAYVSSDAKGCRSVIAGYEQTPIYKIECDGEPV